MRAYLAVALLVGGCCCAADALGEARRNSRSFYARSFRLPSTNSTGQSGQLQHDTVCRMHGNAGI